MKPMKREDQAIQSLKNAKELEELGISHIREDSSNVMLRDALQEYLTAYYILRDKRPDIFKSMCKIGKLIHDRFGCQVKFSGTSYFTDCPVRLSQLNMGLSVGGTEDLICSICGKDPIECGHTPGEKYNNVICQEIRSTCNICWDNKSSCEHIVGQHYDNVEAVRIVTNLRPDHVALVSEPSDPLCRFLAWPVDVRSIIEKLPKDKKDKFEYGKSTIVCNYCAAIEDTEMVR